MKEKLHDSITEELRQGTRTDTIFILSAIFLNLLFTGVNSGVAAAARDRDGDTATIIFFIFIALVVVLNITVIVGLLKGRQRRSKLMAGLMKLYKEEGMQEFYDPSVVRDYGIRYSFFNLTVTFLGVVAIAVPLVMFITL